MPRLIGLEPALDMMLSGKPLTAATGAGSSDWSTTVGSRRLSAGAAIAFARELVRRRATVRAAPASAAVAGGEKAGEIIAARRAQVAKTMRNRNSPNVLLDAVQAR